MKKVMTILAAGILVLFIGNPTSASGDGGDMDSSGGKAAMAEAIEHAEEAKSHKAHTNHIRDHAKESLEYVKKAEIAAIESENTAGRAHISEAIQHLVEAIKHADMGHAQIASEHVTDALHEMYQFMEK